MLHPMIDKLVSAVQGESTTAIIATAVVLFLTWIFLVHLKKRPFFSCSNTSPEQKTPSLDEFEKLNKRQEELSHDRCTDGDSDSDSNDMPKLEPGDIEELESCSADPKAVKEFMAKKRMQAYEIKMSEAEKEKEEAARVAQLSQIYALLNEDKEVFGGEMSMENVQEQLGMYVK